MPLELYKKKRNFNETPEPEGQPKSSKSKLAFVIQRHKASHLHYDFRLEMDGVLKSWAVPKGPSLNPKDKRLAMMVEDHPYDYKDFAGVIPSGYGAGIVEIWDEGTYADLENSDIKTAEKILRAGLHAGNLKFRMFGKKLKGEFAIVKLKSKEDNTWLLIKHNDEGAIEGDYNSEDDTPKNSPINKWLAENKPEKLSKPAKADKKKSFVKTSIKESKKLDDFIKPMLAKETEEPFDDKNWLYEIKWDGYRAIAEVEKGKVKLYSRNGITFENSYPLVVQELQKLSADAVLDGEIVVLNDEGHPEFQLLQHYESNHHRPINYCVFDVLSLNGTNTCELPLIERKELLQSIIKKSEVVKYSDHILKNGIAFFNVSTEKDLEGIMAKKADSQYYIGRRTNEWLKIKNNKTQEAIISGYTSPGGSRKYFGALVLGIKDGDKLKYIGHTGSGFNQQSLKEMWDLLQPLKQDKSPFTEKVKTNMPVTWVKPELVCEIKFTEVTRDGMLRHPIFLHLREDKTVKEVTMENTKPVKKSSVKKLENTVTEKKPVTKKTEKNKAEKEDQPKGEAEKSGDKIFTFGKTKVKTTNLKKIYFPDEGITKGDVINYYIEMADYVLPYLKGRPESLLRTPNGINAKGFFHKDAGVEAPSFVKSKKLFSESTNKHIDYIICDNQPTLTYMNNLGCIEINPWHSTVDDLDNPDYLIIDIDPSNENTFEQVIEAANVVKQVLDKAGAPSYCKTSGSSGLHVYVPTAKKYSYEQVKDFAYLICMLASEQIPAFTTLERNLQKRGHKHIYMDYLQNRKGQTIACVYSLRPKPGATVSTPLLWEEVKSGLTPKDFTIKNIMSRVKKIGDIFKPVLGKGIDLNKCLKNLGG